MIDLILVFLLGVVLGASAVGVYVYWKIRKLKKQMIGDLSLLDQP